MNEFVAPKGKSADFSRNRAGIWKNGKAMNKMHLTRKLAVFVRFKILPNERL